MKLNRKDKKTNVVKTIFCLVGPSASGKSTLIKENKNDLNFGEIISTTTRQPRIGEKNGVDYNFVTKEQFKEMAMLEKDEYSGDFYGTSLDDIKNSLKNKNATMTAITFEGSENIKKFVENNNLPFKVVSIFIDTPIENLKKRMISRGDSPQNIEKRLKNIKNRNEYDNMFKTDYIFIPSNNKSKTNKDFCDFVALYSYGQQYFENRNCAIENTKNNATIPNDIKNLLKLNPQTMKVIEEISKQGTCDIYALSKATNMSIDNVALCGLALENKKICHRFISSKYNNNLIDSISFCLTTKGELISKTKYIKNISFIDEKPEKNNEKTIKYVEIEK